MRAEAQAHVDQINAATALLRRNMLVYGVGGVLLPFAAIKLIDLLLAAVIGA